MVPDWVTENLTDALVMLSRISEYLVETDALCAAVALKLEGNEVATWEESSLSDEPTWRIGAAGGHRFFMRKPANRDPYKGLQKCWKGVCP